MFCGDELECADQAIRSHVQGDLLDGTQNTGFDVSAATNYAPVQLPRETRDARTRLSRFNR